MRHARAIAFAFVCAAAACSAGGGSRIVPNAPSGSMPAKAMTSASFTIHVPAKSTAASTKPQYVSPSTAQISISVNGGTALVSPLNPGASGCTSGSNGFTCTVVVAAPVGGDTFALELLDQNNAVLSTLNVTETVVSGAANSFGVVLGGVIASLTISLATTAPNANGQAQQIALTVNGLDADGNVIMGPGNYNSAIRITDSDTSGTTSLSAGGSTPATTISVAAPGLAVTVNYSGGTLANGATFTASVGGTTVPSQAVTLTPTSGSSTTVSLAISGSPAAIAYSTGTGGSWTSLPSGATSFKLTGTTAYGVAYACSLYTGIIYYVEATTPELDVVPINCGTISGGTLSTTFEFNAFCSGSPTAQEVDIDSQGDDFGGCSSAGTAFSATLDSVTQDVFAMAESGGTNGTSNVLLAIKTAQNTAVPGSATFAFNSTDAVGTATIPSLSQVPASATSTSTNVYFGSFNNWIVPLLVSTYNSSSQTTYYTVASGDVGANDSYIVAGLAFVTGDGTANSVGASAFGSSVPASIALPSPLNETVTAAGSPTFATTYSLGSSSGNVSGYAFSGFWYGGGVPTTLRGLVTAGFIGSSKTLTMPDVAVSTFPSTVAPSDTSYNWVAVAFSVPTAFFATLPLNGFAPGNVPQGVPTSGPSQGTMLFAQAEGGYTVP